MKNTEYRRGTKALALLALGDENRIQEQSNFTRDFLPVDGEFLVICLTAWVFFIRMGLF